MPRQLPRRSQDAAATPQGESVSRRNRTDRDRGSVAVFTVLIATIVLVMAGLAVDVSGHIHAMQEARSVAREAARAGGQQLQLSTAMRGQGVTADAGQAVAAANTYLAAAGVSGSASVSGPTSIRVDVTATYDTRFLSIIGIGSLSATGSADSRTARSLEGVEQ